MSIQRAPRSVSTSQVNELHGAVLIHRPPCPYTSCNLWNRTAHYRTYNSSSLVHVVVESTPCLYISSRSLLILSSNLRLGLPSCLFPCGFRTETLCLLLLLLLLLFPIRATCPVHLLLLNLMPPVII